MINKKVIIRVFSNKLINIKIHLYVVTGTWFSTILQNGSSNQTIEPFQVNLWGFTSIITVQVATLKI